MLGPSAGWTCTADAPRKVPRVAVKGVSKSQSAAALLQSNARASRFEAQTQADLASRRRGVGSARSFDTSGKLDSTALPLCDDDGYREWKARFQANYDQQQRCGDLAQPRRRRLVERTLDAVRGAFDPTEGLEVAAANAADEVLANWRTPSEQRASYTQLAEPRVHLEEVGSPQAPEVTRTRAEQQAFCDDLAKPVREESAPSTPEACKQRVTRKSSQAVQQRHCAQLAQPRPRSPSVLGADADPAVLNMPWREQLAARGNAIMPGDVAKARELLAQMRERSEEAAAPSATSGSGMRSRPSSAQRRLGRPPSAGLSRRRRDFPQADAALVEELKSLVEEVLWVALLQIRSCPTGGPKEMETSLESRLGSLIVSTIGPALRPVARKVLGPGQGLVRRLRSEFPRLAVHLCFRESEDLEPVQADWTSEEVSVHIEEVRGCRDRLLQMDITKTLIPCLKAEITKQCL